MPGITIKVSTEANALLEFYLGYKKMKGENLTKEEAVTRLLTARIESELPDSVKELFEKGKSSKKTVAPSRQS